jgi:hypothetical protein
MTETRNDKTTAAIPRQTEQGAVDHKTLARLQAHRPDYESMRVILWRDIWTSLTLAKHRGNDPMVRAFYEMLFRDAVFDDRGAWSLNIPRPK